MSRAVFGGAAMRWIRLMASLTSEVILFIPVTTITSLAVNQTGCPIAASVNIDQFTIGGKSVGTAEKAVGLHNLPVGDIRGFAVEKMVGTIREKIHDSGFFLRSPSRRRLR